MELSWPKKVGKPLWFDPKDLIAHAMRIFWKYGYENTSIELLETELNISRSSIIHFFKNKKWLFLACIESYRSLLEKHIIHPLQDTRIRADERLDNFFDTLYHIATTGDNAYCGCLIMHHASGSKDWIWIHELDVEWYYVHLSHAIATALSDPLFSGKPLHATEILIAIAMTINNFSRTFPQQDILGTYRDTAKELIHIWKKASI